MKKISLVFMGTAEIGTLLLRALKADPRFEIKAVVTQEDKPAGRKMELTPSPIKQAAADLGLPLLQPENINTPKETETLLKLRPDLIVVFAYGQILKQPLLEIPSYGCINFHTSILPKYRGASPIQSALLNHETVTGVSVMQMAKTLDSGPVYAIFEVPIGPEDDSETLHKTLSEISAEKGPDVLFEIAQGLKKPTPQNDLKATFSKKIRKSDGLIDFTEEAPFILSKIRAYAGWPTAYTFFGGKRLKLLKAALVSEKTPVLPGQVIQKGETVLIASKNGFIKPIIVQMEGKKPTPINEFIKGYPDFINSKLGSGA